MWQNEQNKNSEKTPKNTKRERRLTRIEKWENRFPFQLIFSARRSTIFTNARVSVEFEANEKKIFSIETIFFSLLCKTNFIFSFNLFVDSFTNAFNVSSPRVEKKTRREKILRLDRIFIIFIVNQLRIVCGRIFRIFYVTRKVKDSK
jgi:hypothetical protein